MGSPTKNGEFFERRPTLSQRPLWWLPLAPSTCVECKIPTDELSPKQREIAHHVNFTELIADSDILGQLEPGTLNVEALGEKKWFAKGHVLVEQDQINDKMFLVGHGKLSVVVDDDRVATLQKGNIFGETAVVAVRKANATVKVVSDGAYVLVLRHSDIVNKLSSAAWHNIEELASRRAMENVSYTFLAGIPIFSEASNDFLEALVKAIKFVSFPEGTTILTKGEADNKGMFYIANGEAGIYDSKGLVKALGPQDYVGENMLLAGPGARRL